MTALQDAYPLTTLQAGMLFHSSYQEGSPTYHDVFTLVLHGRYDAAALRAALREVMARHAVLRTSFDLTGFEEPLQLVWDEVEPPLAEVAEPIGAWGEAERGRAFDYGSAPLFRVAVEVRGEAEFGLGLSFHHAILDGWSVSTLTGDLLRRYSAHLAGTPLPVEPLEPSFRDFVATEKAAIADEKTAGFWRDLLDEAPDGVLPRLPGYRAGDTEQAVSHPVAMDEPVVAGLAEAATRLRVPLRTVLLACHLRVLALLTGEGEAVTGVVTHGRPEHEAAGEVLGLFLNTVPLRVRTDVPTWEALIRGVFETEVALHPHRHYPLFEIQRLTGRAPAFDALFDYRDFKAYRELGGDGLAVSETEFFEQTNLAYAANFTWSPRTRRLGLTLKYDRTQFAAGQIERAAAYYRRAFADVAADLAIDPRESGGYVAADAAVIAGWNATGPGVSGTLPALLAAQAERTPDAVAVVGPSGSTLTYTDFSGRVRDLAGALQAAGVGAGSVVGVCLPRSVDLVVAVHAVVAAGGAYLPLEPSYPDERLTFLTGDADAQVIITDSADRFPSHTTVPPTAPLPPTAPPPTASLLPTASSGGRWGGLPEVSPHAPAYVIYTSGSTGNPKGVVVSHAAIVNRLLWMSDAFPLTPEDRILHKTPFTFDVSVWELFWPLIAGAGTIVAGPDDHRDTAALTRLIREHAVTTLHFVPSMLEALVEETPSLPSLRRVICSGEALPTSLAERFHTAFPGVELHNLYGPTEAAVDVTWHACRPGESRTPIGKPITGISIEILDRNARRVPIGTPGELCIAGAGLADGYRGRPALTAAQFTPHPDGGRLYRTGDLARWLPDGEVEYLGRIDHQVKIRGMRVEPGEVEATIGLHPNIRSAVVVPYKGGLACYVVLEPGTVAELSDVTAFLRARLPEHMVPSAFLSLERLPTTANGKLDRKALPDPAPAPRPPYEAPRDELEEHLAKLFADVLGVEEVGIRDDFFALGGHSLLALRLAMRLRQDLGREVPVATILPAPTVAQLAAALRHDADTPVGKGRIVPLREGGDRTPVFLIHALGGEVFRYQPLATALGEDQPVYAIPAHGLAEGETPHATIAEMAEAYAAYVRSVRPHGPYALGGFCIGGNIALEVARRLRSAGEEVPAVFLAWSSADEPVVRRSLEDDLELMGHALAGGLTTVDIQEFRHLEPAEQLLSVINAASSEGTLRQRPDDLAYIRRYLDVFRANAHAVGHYTHEPYDGRAVLLIPEGDGVSLDEDYGWRAVCDRLDVGYLPGARFSSFFPPYVARTATEWRRWMDHGTGDDGQ
ncbi:amino acid adenylation domain-containing protein [Nonomuraea sp. NPDC059007]|uniref:amino acid adenylation domain-containing protein n=1 Tax=Nonomuraea sp. NPDC059007 TaxID=3346692 RepID=UPI003691A907